ncbi:MAG TPA: T9SS type A sorting domain-containing protein [Ignavibacteria bacterium]|nr:T9SS type A sorting domain-containing protein [Ignavibacteria bacterium]HRA99672.1 T9SS type A sorting domain-containing protein [Ignavibacteria bacterium]
MKNSKLFFAIMFMFLISFSAVNSNATIVNITASNFSFTPVLVNVTVGDTVKWTWTSGSHTTTCDGQQGTVLPNGAASWDAELSSNAVTYMYVVTVPGKYLYVCTPHAPDMSGIINVAVSSISQINEIATGYKLSQNFPNPFNPETKINFSIPSSGFVDLKVYNAAGQNVASLVNQRLSSGTYNVNWNASDVTSGVYFYTLKTENFTETKKMLLIR